MARKTWPFGSSSMVQPLGLVVAVPMKRKCMQERAMAKLLKSEFHYHHLYRYCVWNEKSAVLFALAFTYLNLQPVTNTLEKKRALLKTIAYLFYQLILSRLHEKFGNLRAFVSGVASGDNGPARNHASFLQLGKLSAGLVQERSVGFLSRDVLTIFPQAILHLFITFDCNVTL
ncbi:hypothetical protein SNOG_13955 [Parastagonospora nodorum SN15]|uniref:Uncharacterized protein n=1 Tax=Phaeosphaeria nodorum (strain SN15 / ATCC MYA-4574 / FGSC 10173) TaxID=321614 RepID=Q0U2T6_PHANO|nr:hypothetical protein SNOG_13955 [Parastagonospora nodorum SN15]EAT78580.1 hypothetical protein SNOG_13955 [Parastagonospora nodorum SN15]